MGFGGESSGGEYHTMYDSYELYKRFKDPDFSYGVTLAKVAGRTSLRLANADVLPFEFLHFTNTVGGYINEVTKLVDEKRMETEKHNRLLKEGIYELAADPKEYLKIPDPKEEIPYLNFAPIHNAMNDLKKQAKSFEIASKSNSVDSKTAKTLNQLLRNMEPSMTRAHGLPRRPWFRHHIYAPGFYTGYGVKTLPGVREAIEQQDFEEAQEQIEILGEVLRHLSLQIEKAVKVIRGKS